MLQTAKFTDYAERMICRSQKMDRHRQT